VELFNASPETLDIGGLNLTDEKRNTFRVPLLTSIIRESPIVFSNVVTTLDPEKSLTLRDARTVVLDDVRLTGVLPVGASFERKGPNFIVNFTPTPGSFDSGDYGAGASGKGAEKVPTLEPLVASSTLKASAKQAVGDLSQRLPAPLPTAKPSGQPEQNVSLTGAKQNLAWPAFASYSGKTFVLLAFTISIMGAVAFVALKRKML